MPDQSTRELDLLRPVLEWVVGEVKRGKSAEVPRSLRPVLRFKKLPPSALRQVQRAVDTDDAFRQRVATRLTDSTADEVGRVWLRRDDGWRSLFDRLVAAEDRRLDGVEQALSEDDLARRTADAEARVERAEADLAEALTRIESLEADLAGERQARESAERSATELTTSIESAQSERAQAVRQLKQAEALAQRRLDDYRALQAQRLADAPAAIAEPSPVPAVDVQELQAMVDKLRRQIDDTRHGLEGTYASLDAAEALLAEGVPRTGSAAPGQAVTVAVPDPTTLDGDPVSYRPRSATTLPPGLRDDSVEAAQHLVRVQGAVMLVDGYNQSMYRWADRPISAQRQALTQQLSALAARTGVSIDVVFDGDGNEAGSMPGARSIGLRVRFSPADIEADDVILELCDVYPQDQTVIVASDDRRVRDGAAAAGANLIGAAQLHGLLT